MFDTPQAIRGGGAGRRRAQRARAKIGAVLACALGAAPFAASALPVIPQGSGFGIDTPAGRGGQVYRVTNLNESGPGSLHACVAASGPRVCVFEVSGAIRLTKDLHIWNPNITIAGQTAPSPGIMLRGAALNINASNVLVQHISIRVGDDPVGPAFVNRDALKIESATPIKNIVVDHCSLTWALDETVAVWDAWDNVTLSNNIIAEGLYEKADGKQSGYGLLLGQDGGGRATVVGNLLAHNRARNPLNRSHSSVFVNNIVYNAGGQSATFQSMNGVVTQNTIVGNVFIRGADTIHDTPVNVSTGAEEYPLPLTSKLYLADNVGFDSASGGDWSIATSGLPASIKAALPPIWPAGLTRLSTDDNVAFNQVLKFTGSRPAARDPVDARIVKSVRDRTGRIINCVSANGTARCNRNAGGWPAMAQNRRALSLPEGHNDVTPSGYTKLEIWLHQMAAQVEGRSAPIPEPPVLAIRR
ncbi:MAG: pectate lyase family protein [Steroidobacter sp.]